MKTPTIETFKNNVANHQLTVHFDEGLHRHITMKNPTSSDMHYHITTWPNYLCISGDMGCFVFSRVEDMFKFFRGEEGEVNPCYWAEKLQAPEYNDKSVMAWSTSKVKASVNRLINEWVESAEEDGFDEEFIQEQKGKAIDLIHSADNEYEFISSIYNFYADEDGISVDDFFCDSDFTDYTYHYLWCCYAIVHAINVYDQYKSAQEAVT